MQCADYKKVIVPKSAAANNEQKSISAECGMPGIGVEMIRKNRPHKHQ